MNLLNKDQNLIKLFSKQQSDTLDTTCPYCGVGCGLSISKTTDTNNKNNTSLNFSGNQQHPANLGKLCVKGSSLQQTIGMQQRLLQPARFNKTTQQSQILSWQQSLDEISSKLRQVILEHGPDAVAFYGSGQLLTEDYYLANKLMKGFIGSANIDTNSRLCMSSAVSAYKQSFGCDGVPVCYDDLDHADLIILTGSNAAWTHPILYQRMVANKEKNPNLKIVVIDPKTTASCDIADLHLKIAPGSDNFVFTALLNYLEQHDKLDNDYINTFTENFSDTIKHCQRVCQENDISEKTGAEHKQLEEFFKFYANSQKTLTFYSQGINQSARGVNKASNIINCHLAMGKIGKKGCGPFSITGQPNAMGGREVGGLANQLAAHMDFSKPHNIDLVKRFWQSDSIASKEGLKAVDMFEKIDQGKIKFVWIMATNPVVSLPNSNKIRRALLKCPTVVVSECMQKSDTLSYADYHLPALSWGEKDGTVTNSERRISRQRAFLPAPGEAKADWWIIAQIAKRLGFAKAFDFENSHQVFLEHAKLSAFENNRQQSPRLFDLSALQDLSKDQYDQLKPIQWPVNKDYPEGCARLYADGNFHTKSGKAQFIIPQANLPSSIANKEQHPLSLNTGRLRDQWHTMTRTGRVKNLNQTQSQPFVLIHPTTAKQYQINNNQLVAVENPLGKVIVKSKISDEVAPNHLFLPIHWNNCFSSQALASNLISDIRDPQSGQPESKFERVKISNLDESWRAFIIGESSLEENIRKLFIDAQNLQTDNQATASCSVSYWSKSQVSSSDSTQVIEKSWLSGQGLFDQVNAFEHTKKILEDCIESLQGAYDLVHYQNHNEQECRFVIYKNEPKPSNNPLFQDASHTRKLIACIYLQGTKGQSASKNALDDFNSDWLSEQIEQQTNIDSTLRYAPLYGIPATGEVERGKVICACFQVRDSKINEFIEQSKEPVDVQLLAKELKCGSNCGSCIPELKALINEKTTSE